MNEKRKETDVTEPRTPERLIEVATSHLGEPAEENTCVRKGAYPWAIEAGLPYPQHSDGNGHSTTNVTDLVDAAKRGIDGYRYLPVSEKQHGDFLIWGDDEFHISVYVDDAPGGARSIGAGGPTGVVAYQPRGGRTGNPDSAFSGVVRPPFEAAASTPTPSSDQGVQYEHGWLGKGSRGPKVRAMKERLVRDYFYAEGLEVDDEFGDFCDQVVREFQERAGLEVDGLAGPVMFDKLGLAW